MSRLIAFMSCLMVLAVGASGLAQQQYPERWNYVVANLSSDQGLEQFLAVLKQSKEVGCTHILLREGRWLRTPDDQQYLQRVAKAKQAASEANITIVPLVYAFGYSGRYLAINPNLGAGLPVKDMVYIVQGNRAKPDPAQALDTSQFTAPSTTYKTGQFKYYRMTLYTKQRPQGEPFRATGVQSRRWLTRTNPVIKQVGDRWMATNTFNSLDSEDVRIQVMVQDYEDFTIEPAGALLILRRELTPLKVTSEDGQTVYEEGRDFKQLVDPNIAAGSGDYNSDHQPNDIELTENSRIKDGQKLLVSFFHGYKIYADQNVVSMEDPEVFQIMEQDIADCVRVWQPAGMFMNYDEIRIGGWERADMPLGQLLAEHTKKGYDLIKKHSPDAKVYTWSDMYTPHHNARPVEDRGFYYLCRTNWDGSWEGLPSDIIIMSWSASGPAIKWFGDRGHQQVLCGYYDARDTEGLKRNITRWKEGSAGVPNVLGFMYTTWHNNYTHMKEYFQLLDTYEQWKQ